MKKIILFSLTLILYALSTSAQTCMTPTAVTATNITATSADIGWTENNTPPATIWDLEIIAMGGTPTGVPTIVGVTANPYNLSGLAPNFALCVYVRSNCSATNLSAWSAPHCFTPSGVTSTANTNNKTNILIYPNPATNYITIDAAKTNTKEISICDITGKQIKNYKGTDAKINIQTDELNAGLYFCKVTLANNETIIKKIIIEGH